MSVRVAINGFGRIGRPFFRLAFEDPCIDIVAINDLMDNKAFAHLLQYDSTFGKYKREVSYDDDNLIVDGKKIKLFSVGDPKLLPWKELNIDIVLEATGRFTTMEKASAHLAAGAKKVILSAPPKGEMPTFVYGINHTAYNPAADNIISNASCTTNALAPVAKVLDAAFGIKSGMMTTVHSYTNDQAILDKAHRDLRRARTAGPSIIPTTTGATKAVELVLPQLHGKLSGCSIRVPTPDVSLIDFTVNLNQEVTSEELNKTLQDAANTTFKGLIGYSEEPLVSIDYIGETNSCVVDALSTMVVEKKLAKIILWYDNEYGYSCRLKDLIKYMEGRS